jgi:nucleotide-binding universal stress UspA family protein
LKKVILLFLNLGYNLQIIEQAEEELAEIKKYLEGIEIEYELIMVEKEGEMGQDIEKWFVDFKRRVYENEGINLVVVGTRNNGPLKRLIFKLI